MTVTVCVPVYRAGGFVAQTLASVARQRHRDLRVLVGVEPPWEESEPAIAAFLGDPRFRMVLNPDRLGWDANVASLLRSVDTSYFFILPHDDLVHPAYVESLLDDVSSHRGAVVSYSDMVMFGDGRPRPKSVVLPRDGSRVEQVLAFLLQGAEATPWRGVTAREVLDEGHGFPVDGHDGYAVECEWALRLLVQGRALRCPRPLYVKRLWGPQRTSASLSRLIDHSGTELVAAWRDHRSRMEALVREALEGAPADPGMRLLVGAALHGAMLRRYRLTIPLPLEPDDAAAADDLVGRLAAVDSADGRRARSNLLEYR